MYSMPRIFLFAAAVLLLAAAIEPVRAEAVWQQRTPEQDDRIVARTAIPDLTPQQRYQTAVSEANGGLKLNLGACKDLATSERGACAQQAQALYRQDMVNARAALRAG